MKTGNSNSDNSTRVEAYLDRILIPLTRRLTPFHRAELRRELKAHLWERVDAYRELGQSEDDAVTEALRQFGGAEDFTRQWRREWTKTPAQRVTLSEVWQVTRPLLRPSLLGIALALVPFGLPTLPLLLGQFYTMPWAMVHHVEANLFWPLAVFSYLLLPVLIGERQGRRAPERAGLGMTVMLALELVTTSLLYLLCPMRLSSEPSVDSFFSILLTLLLVWLPLSGTAASLSGWWTQRRKRVVA